MAKIYIALVPINTKPQTLPGQELTGWTAEQAKPFIDAGQVKAVNVPTKKTKKQDSEELTNG